MGFSASQISDFVSAVRQVFTPSPPAFTAVTGAALNAVVTSDSITLTGSSDIVYSLLVRGDGSPEIQVNGGAWGQFALARPGDTIRLRLTTSGTINQVQTVTLYGVGQAVSWNITNASWTPAMITGLKAWFDADDAASLTAASGKVSQWNDKSGQGKHATQATSSLQPSITAAGLNGKSVVSFASASAQRMYFASIFSGNPTYTAVVVAKIGTTGANAQCVLTLGGFSNNVTTMLGSYQSANYTHWQFGSGAVLLANKTVNATILTATRNAASNTNTISAYSGSTSVNQTAISMSGTNQLGGADGSYPLEGFVAEVIIFDTLSTADLQKAQGYLAWKWGLAGDLPAGHPYKSSAP